MAVVRSPVTFNIVPDIVGTFGRPPSLVIFTEGNHRLPLSSRIEQFKECLTSNWENLLALIDSRVADALDRDQRERCEATAYVVRRIYRGI
jgi:hypothetical protein